MRKVINVILLALPTLLSAQLGQPDLFMVYARTGSGGDWVCDSATTSLDDGKLHFSAEVLAYNLFASSFLLDTLWIKGELDYVYNNQSYTVTAFVHASKFTYSPCYELEGYCTGCGAEDSLVGILNCFAWDLVFDFAGSSLFCTETSPETTDYTLSVGLYWGNDPDSLEVIGPDEYNECGEFWPDTCIDRTNPRLMDSGRICCDSIYIPPVNPPTTSISEADDEPFSPIAIWPNPVNSLLQLRNDKRAIPSNVQIEIYSIYGDLGSLNLPFHRLSRHVLELDVSGLVSGIYFIKVIDMKGAVIAHSKFLKH